MSEASNRAFLYGESVFTTMRMIDGQVIDWNYHFERLKRGIDFVYGPFLEEDWVSRLKDKCEARCQLENGNKVLRLTVFREQNRGLMRSSLISFNDLRISLISSVYEPLRSSGKMLSLRTCAAPARPFWWPNFLKAGNYLETILAQKMYLKTEDDDLLFLSIEDTILESSVANIFVVKKNKLFTAPLGKNVLDGVMRKKILEVALEFFEDASEEETTLEQLWKADAIFGCNSIRGPFLIGRVDEHNFNYGDDFLEKFDRLKRRVFE
jgi:branched-subunit amino acid aminotransferase/4-amino-4-deoxychorismate lyase